MLDHSKSPKRFQAHEKYVQALHRSKRLDILVSLGVDEGPACIKIWRLNQMDETAPPILSRTISPFGKKLPETPVTAFACLDDCSQIVLGLSSGGIVLLEGELVRDRSTTQRLLKEDGPPIAGVKFVESSDFKEHYLFVVSDQYIATYFTKKTNAITMKILDEREGCSSKCFAVTDSGMLAVAREAAVFFYQKDDLGPTYGFDGRKKLLRWSGSYLVLVCEDLRGSGNDLLTVYDLSNQFIAFSGKFEGIADIVSEWSSLFIVQKNGNVIQLSEKDLYKKMELLFKRNLYTIAINLAKAQELGQQDIAEIFKEYGDHLYAKGDFDRAIAQYCKTVDAKTSYIEPSYVIRKFLDAQRIDNLTTYLERLHSAGCANKDHTTLLLNCFTKSKDVGKLDTFIRESALTTNGASFDVDTAIRVCRQAGYFSHALHLAKSHKKSVWVLRVLMEDSHDPAAALDFLWTLDGREADFYLRIYGQELMGSNPAETTELLKHLCVPNEGEYGAPAEEFIHVFVGRSEYLQIFLEAVAENVESSQTIYNTLLEIYLRSASQDTEKILQMLRSKQGKYDPEHALVLARTYGCQEAELFLYQRLGLYNEILRYHMDREDSSKVIEICEQFEEEDKKLWIRALVYFGERSDEEQCVAYLQKSLRMVEEHELMPPLAVVRLLAKNPSTPLGVVQQYLLEKFEEEQTSLERDEKEVRQYLEETERMKSEIQELSSTARTFQSTKCHLCKNSLDVPIVHFLCMHSYHARCVQDTEDQCPICAPEYRRVMDMKHSMEASLGDHETFFKLLHSDGFSAVSEYFGRGILKGPDISSIKNE